LSAKEVVELAAKEGTKLTAAAVYNIRSAAGNRKAMDELLVVNKPKVRGRQWAPTML